MDLSTFKFAQKFLQQFVFDQMQFSKDDKFHILDQILSKHLCIN